MNGVKWVRRSLRTLSRELKKKGHQASRMTIRRLLMKRRYSLKKNVKNCSGPPHPDRDRQFSYIASQKDAFSEKGLPIISVDTKKKELIGNFKNEGRLWCQTAEQVDIYDFPQNAVGQAVPYGIYEMTRNQGYVCVGVSADTPQFAVDAIAHWWEVEGQNAFPESDKILILADAGGSNGYRPRLWKQQLQKHIADRLGLEVTVCHYPAGASKWNPVEHRLFSPISMNWAGKPLRSFDTILACIRGTSTETGLQVKATLLNRQYEKGVKVSDQHMKGLNLSKHDICPEWNYTIKPGSHRSMAQ